MENKKTILFNKHVALGAKMAPFAGFEMPIQYTSVKEEVAATRQGAAVFDVSHMGEFFFEGPEALDFVDSLVVNDIRSAGERKAVYTPMCYENGTVVDDMIVYKISDDRILMCVNASNMEKDWNHIKKFDGKFKCKLSNKTDDYSLLAVQGPKAIAILEQQKIIPASEGMPYYSVRTHQFAGKEIIIARTGYTGEDGVELFCDHKTVDVLWDTLLKNGVTPCGLASRDVLRLEVCFPLYGHELSEELTPLDSGLAWTVKFSKKDFMGKTALFNYKPKWQLVKFTTDMGVPRQGQTVEDAQGNVVGQVASGTFSPTIQKGIAMAHIAIDKMPSNKEFVLDIRGKKYKTTVHKKAFVTGGHK